jgi:phosphate starvation-inducible membrane PsiE
LTTKVANKTKLEAISHYFILYSWFIIGIIFLLIVTTIIFNIFKVLIIFDFSKVKDHMPILIALAGGIVLFQELAVLSFTAVKEGGHFPLRYIFLFGIIALVIGIVFKSKGTINVSEMIVLTSLVIVFTLVYFCIKYINEKYDLKH